MAKKNPDALKLRIFELEAELIMTNLYLDALAKLTALNLETSESPKKLFHAALTEIARNRGNEIFRAYADNNREIASILRRLLDERFPPPKKK